MKTKLHFCYIWEGMWGCWAQPRHAVWLVGYSVFGSPQGLRLVDCVVLPVESLSSSGPVIVPPVLQQDSWNSNVWSWVSVSFSMDY